jgi:hypothetical protein
MEPVAVWVRTGNEWAIIHRCLRCSSFRSNRIAGDDDPKPLIALAQKPLIYPAFPIDSKELFGGQS